MEGRSLSPGELVENLERMATTLFVQQPTLVLLAIFGSIALHRTRPVRNGMIVGSFALLVMFLLVQSPCTSITPTVSSSRWRFWRRSASARSTGRPGN